MSTEVQQAYTINRAEAVLRRLKKDLARLEPKARTVAKTITFDSLVEKSGLPWVYHCAAYPYQYQP